MVSAVALTITALHPSDNHMGETVLNLFLSVVDVYGVPSRVWGDHGVENIKIAAWMEAFHGERRGSYIWGRSVVPSMCSLLLFRH